MSLLIFQHYKNDVAVFTDTLATTPDGDPLAFCNKAFVQPHLGIVMAVTGILQFGEAWDSDLNGPVFAESIDDLDKRTPTELRRIWKALSQQYENWHGATVKVTSTIYHFGWSHERNQYVRCVYRSENDFRSEYHTTEGIGIKPQPKNPKGMPSPETPQAVIDYAEHLRKQYLALPKSERIYIGGELTMMLMQNLEGGIKSVATAKIYKFTGYDQDMKAIQAMRPDERRKHLPVSTSELEI